MKTKQMILSMLAMSGILFATSCSQDELGNGSMGNTVEAKFTIKTPEGISTRAVIGDGTTVDKVKCVVYDANGEKMELDQTLDLVNKGATYNTRLVKGQKYRIAFFAYNGGANAYDVRDLTDIKVNPALSNIEDRDAFTAYIDVEANETQTNGTLTKNVTLYRPFAQLNIGSCKEDIDAAIDAGVDNVVKTQVTVTNVYTAFNAYKDKVAGDRGEVTFELNNLPGGDLMADGNGDGTDEPYTYLALNYLLVGDKNSEKATTNVTFEWKAANGKTNNPATTFNNIPVQRNYRTNIVGYVLTNWTTCNIVVDDKFNDPDYNIYDQEKEGTEEVIPIKMEAVDLGLSVKWANSVYGVTSENLYGGLFTVAEAEETVAGLGDEWRLPTRQECEELLNCTWTETTENGVNGYRVSNNENSIFLPKAGFYDYTNNIFQQPDVFAGFWSGTDVENYNTYRYFAGNKGVFDGYGIELYYAPKLATAMTILLVKK